MGEAVHNNNTLSGVSDVYTQLQQLFQCVCRANEPFRLSEARFNAHPYRLNALGSATMLIDAVSALFLLHNGNVDNARKI